MFAVLWLTTPKLDSLITLPLVKHCRLEIWDHPSISISYSFLCGSLYEIEAFGVLACRMWLWVLYSIFCWSETGLAYMLLFTELLKIWFCSSHFKAHPVTSNKIRTYSILIIIKTPCNHVSDIIFTILTFSRLRISDPINSLSLL